MSCTIEWVESDFHTIAAKVPRFTDAFFARLLALRPSLAQSFAPSPKQRQGQLINALDGIVQRLDHPAELRRHVHALALKTAQHGLADDTYEAIDQSLMAALAEVIGPAWPPAHTEVWTNICAVVRGLAVESLDIHHCLAA